MNAIRQAARELRLFIDSGGRLSMEEAAAKCVTRDDALTAFDATEDDADGVRVVCCGQPAQITDGIFGAKIHCGKCGADARDATSPMWSPFLERGNSYMTMPSEKFLALFGDRNWIVMNEGDRP